MGLVALEAAIRAVSGRQAGVWGSRTNALVLMLVGLSAAAGLALLVLGERPHELLHLVYAVLAFGMVPTADTISARWPGRGGAIGRLIGAGVGLIVIWRLFQTG